ncbi:hypothetical protein [Shewanella sp.]|uniref:hypothetical protein n=1 Tax=Shewanella sp. TaxID=50422 RepID=UPI003A8675BC
MKKTIYASMLAAAGYVTASTSAFANDYTAQIEAVKATAETNQGAIAGAVIAVAAVSFGLGLLVRWLR